MKRTIPTAILVALAALSLASTTVSCRQLFTASLGESLARDSISIPSSTSVSKLVSIAETTGKTDPDVAKEVLDVLAGKDQADLLDLSDADSASVLDLATTAAIDVASLMNLVNDISSSSGSENQLIDTMLGSFDTSVNLDAVETLLGDAATIATAPVETIVLATAAVIADLADEVGSTTAIMDILAYVPPSSAPGYGTISPEQQDTIDLIVSVRNGLDARPDEETVIAGFDLSELLKGNN